MLFVTIRSFAVSALLSLIIIPAVHLTKSNSNPICTNITGSQCCRIRTIRSLCPSKCRKINCEYYGNQDTTFELPKLDITGNNLRDTGSKRIITSRDIIASPGFAPKSNLPQGRIVRAGDIREELEPPIESRLVTADNLDTYSTKNKFGTYRGRSDDVPNHRVAIKKLVKSEDLLARNRQDEDHDSLIEKLFLVSTTTTTTTTTPLPLPPVVYPYDQYGDYYGPAPAEYPADYQPPLYEDYGEGSEDDFGIHVEGEFNHCCSANNVPARCLPMCSYDGDASTVTQILERGASHCLGFLHPILYCASQSRNNWRCCKEAPYLIFLPHCHRFCAPNTESGIGNFRQEDAICLDHWDIMLQCHKDGLVKRIAIDRASPLSHLK